MSEGAFVCQCLIVTITLWLVIGTIVSKFNNSHSKDQPGDFILKVPAQIGNFSNDTSE